MAILKYINENNEFVELGNAAPFLVTAIDGLGSPQNEIYTQKSPYQDGVTVTHSSLEPRNIVIEGKIIDSNRKNRQAYRDKLLSVFNPKLNGKLIIDLGDVKRQIDCIVEQAPYFSSKAERNYQDFSISLLAPDPFFKDIEGIETDLVTWIPNLEFDAVEGFSTEQLENHWIETQIKKQGLQVFKKGTIYLELEEESTVPEVEIAYLLENGQYKRLRQQVTVFSTGTGYDENGNYVDVSDSIVNGQINDIKIEGKTYRNVLEDYLSDINNWERLYGELIDNDFIKATADATYKAFWLKADIITLKPSTQYTIFVEVRKNTINGNGLVVTSQYQDDSFGVINIISPGETGIFKFLVTTKSDLTNTLPLRMYINSTATSGEIEFRVMLLEGDYTNENISYIRGTKSTLGAIRLKSVGKNLLNIKNTYAKASGYIITDTGYIRSAGQTGDIQYILEVEKDANYTVSRKILQGNSRITVRDFYTNEYLVSFNSSPICTFKATSDKVRLIFDTASIYVNEITEVADIQVEKGIQATEYEPYKESTHEEGNILELRSLPNGVKDEIDVSGRRVIKRTKKIIFDGSENWTGFLTSYADTNGFYRMKIDGWVTQNKAVTGYNTGLAWNDLTTFRIAPLVSTGGSPNSIGFYTDGNLYLLLPRDYIDANYSPTLDGMKQYLNDHPITLIYQLAEPIVKLLPPEPLTTFEEFESGIGVGEPIEFGYRLTKQIVEIENIGDVDAPIRVVFRAHGQVEKPYIQDVETREMIRINKTLEAGDVLEITTEFGNKNVYLNGEKAHHYLDYINSTWLQLKPGINLIKYGAESGTEVLECRLYFTPRYLGV